MRLAVLTLQAVRENVYLSQYNQLVEDLAEVESQIALVQASLKELVAKSVKSFEFNSGEASQRATLENRRELKALELSLKQERDLLQRKLRGTANVRVVSGRRW